MHSNHDPRLVVLSVFIATLASAVAFGLVARTTLARGWARQAWIGGGAVAMGLGIWSMHFVGMLAFHLHGPHGRVALAYDVPLVVLSVLVALAAAALALGIAVRPALSRGALAGSALLMGTAIAGMHYIGMAAMRMPARLGYDHLMVALSLLVAAGASFAAIWLFRRLGNAHSRAERWARRGASVVMGLAIAGVHYTAMAAARFTDGTPHPGIDDALLATSGLAVSVALGTLVVFGLAAAGIAWDRAHRSALDESIRESETRLRVALSAADLVVWEWDLGAGEAIVYSATGEPLARDARMGVQTMRDATFMDEVHPDDQERVRAAFDRASAPGVELEMEYRTRHTDGEWRWRYVRGHVTADDAGVPTRVVGVGMDVTRRKELEEQLVHQAFHDPLTGLANRVLFHDRVEHALARSARGGSVPAVLFLDLDNFKNVNDGFGHAVGDRLLVEIAGRLARGVRAADTCARLGGDEFAVLLEDGRDEGEAAQQAAHVAERLITAFQAPFTLPDGTTMVTGASIGIATAVAGESAEVLLRNADLAMYRAKHGGRGQYAAFEQQMHASVRHRLELEAELRAAVGGATEHDAGRSADAPQFELHYQPIVELGAGGLSGFEALVRWRHPRRGLVSPGEFIPIAEESGLIVPLGRWVLREACRQVAAWQRERPAGLPSLRVSVNISGRQLAEPELPREVRAALDDAGLPASALVLEVTESMLVDDGATTLERLHALKALGLELAIDDFGTGYSSLGYLQRFPVDVLKIDKTFVDDLGGLEPESPLANAIVGLGSALGMRVVAEGIETAGQWSHLREIGCEYGQGFYFARPLTVSAARALLAAEDGAMGARIASDE